MPKVVYWNMSLMQAQKSILSLCTSGYLEINWTQVWFLRCVHASTRQCTTCIQLSTTHTRPIQGYEPRSNQCFWFWRRSWLGLAFLCQRLAQLSANQTREVTCLFSFRVLINFKKKKTKQEDRLCFHRIWLNISIRIYMWFFLHMIKV